MNKPVGTAGYQVMLAALLSINFGIVFFDRNASNFLMPFIQPDLHLNNTQVGVLAGALSFTWAIAAFGIGLVSDKTGSRKGLLIRAVRLVKHSRNVTLLSAPLWGCSSFLTSCFVGPSCRCI
jgi:sugar phosphate permease